MEIVIEGGKKYISLKDYKIFLNSQLKSLKELISDNNSEDYSYTHYKNSLESIGETIDSKIDELNPKYLILQEIGTGKTSLVERNPGIILTKKFIDKLYYSNFKENFFKLVDYPITIEFPSTPMILRVQSIENLL